MQLKKKKRRRKENDEIYFNKYRYCNINFLNKIQRLTE